ncbi:MAG TPA: VOC family protein, partial [Candidatus Limnocylindrales bacterium]|nr:VOC family protein [Candidatus Limnocylindrales bacterium]
MLLGIDHIVLAVEDPDATAAALEAEVGLVAGGGGRHDALGTFNRLVWLGDSYLELIGVFDVAVAARGWLGPAVLATIERGGGLATWAVAVDDLDRQLTWLPPDAG